MSYAIGTPNFNLPQTQGSDKRDWSDTNQAFADIDAAIKTAGDDSTLALSAAQTAQTSADGAVTDAASAVSTANAAASQAATASELASLARTEAQGAATTAQSAATTAQSAQTTATNADTVALAAQSSIGTMSNLQTQDKTSLVAAINEVLSQIGGGMPTLDYTNPLFVSATNNLSYTATQECYVIGQLSGAGSTITAISINNTEVCHCPAVSAYAYGATPILKLSTGDTVSISRTDATSFYKVYAEKTA